MGKIKRIVAKTDVFKLAIDDEDGNELGIISIHVSDINLVNRIQSGYKKIELIIKSGEEELEKIGYDDKKTNGLMSNSEYFSKIEEIDRELKKELNNIFDTDISSVFGKTNLMTPTSSGYFVINILNAIIPAIKEEMTKVSKMSEKSYEQFQERH